MTILDDLDLQRLFEALQRTPEHPRIPPGTSPLSLLPPPNNNYGESKTLVQRKWDLDALEILKNVSPQPVIQDHALLQWPWIAPISSIVTSKHKDSAAPKRPGKRGRPPGGGSGQQSKHIV